MNKDLIENRKIIKTFILEDKGQDFVEIDLLENGVVFGNSPIFSNGRLSMIGVGNLDGAKYFTFNEIRLSDYKKGELDNLYIYVKKTSEKLEPAPWDADTLKYKIKYTHINNLNKFIK